jgi:TolB-like protein/tetratricopeptide (TPR) repeat protein
MDLVNFFAELKRRKVYSVAVSYAVAGWLLVQIATQTFPFLEIPNWAIRLVIMLVATGFPLVLVLAWIYDFTRHGLKRTENVDAFDSRAGQVVTAKIDIVPRANGEKSIAVLPFTDTGAATDRDYLGDGIAEEILSALAKIDGLRVAARRSSFWFKDKKADLSEIAEKLNVEHVLEGSVRREGNRVRITAELTECCNGFTLWSETFEREFQGIFALQDEITRATVDALKLKLDIAPPTTSRFVRSTAAYDVYLHGLFYSDKTSEEDLRKSVEYFERALEKDPQFGRAWTGIAKAWLWLADAYVLPLQAYAKVREAATNALKIDNDDAEAHVYLGEATRILDWDMDGAAREFCQAVNLDPKSTPSNYFSAAFWAARGEREEALGYLQRTSTIDPASLWVNNSACELYRYFGLYDEAMAAGKRALQLDPAFIYGEPLLGALYRETGRFDEAIALYEKAQKVSGRPGFGLAITYARMNQRDDALRTLAAATANRRYTPGDAIAHVRVALGDHDAAIGELERARDERSSSLHFVGIAPEFVPLRGDERFLSILRKIGLDPKKVFVAAAG